MQGVEGLEFVGLLDHAPKAPLCKGGCQPKRLTGGLLFFTIPPTKIKDFGHLPLHKGGSRYALHLLDKLKFEKERARRLARP